MAWAFLRDYKVALTGIIMLQLVQIILSLWLPAINARIIDEGIMNEDTALIWRLGLLMLLVAVIQISCMVGAIYLGAKTAMGFGKDLRAQTFRHVQAFSATDQHSFGAPSLITRTTNDVTQMQMVILMTFTVLVTAPIMGIGGIIMAIQQDVQLSWLLVVVVPLLALIITGVMVKLLPRYSVLQERVDAINTRLREQLTGVRVIRAFLRQKTEREKFDKANKELRQTWLEIGLLWAFMMPAASVVIGLASAAVVWFGGMRIESGGMEVGALTAYISYLMMIMGSVMMGGMMAMIFPRGEVSAKRIKEILETKPSVVSPENPVKLPDTPVTFELRKATLQYPGAENPVLRDIDLKLSPGTTSAVIGSTGSGKSSLVRLIPRLIDATGGGVTANDISVKDVDVAELRSRVAVVPQKAFLFSGTIASNVAGFGRKNAEFDHARVRRALEAAQAWDFVSKMDDGVNSVVEAGGKNFSGGQRQRLTIARAIYRCIPDENGHRMSDLLVFDDSFSALDFTTDSRLRASLPEYIGDVAVLIIAQRVSTIRQADEILVLEGGDVVGRGTHAQLMQTCDTYQEIVQSQMSLEEAA